MPLITHANLWIIETAHTAYAFGLNRAGALVNTYWGPRLPYTTDYPAPEDNAGYASFNGAGQRWREEYPAQRGQQFTEPCLRAVSPFVPHAPPAAHGRRRRAPRETGSTAPLAPDTAGEYVGGHVGGHVEHVRDVQLAFVRAEHTHPRRPNEQLRITLADALTGLTVTLCYTWHKATDLIVRWAEITNAGPAPITLERALSAQWHLPPAPAGSYHLRHLTGRWLDEWHIRTEPLGHGTKRLESRRLHTGHHQHPWFAIAQPGATETSGGVWFGALAWSGNWLMLAEATDFASTRVSLGVNDWDWALTLAPGEKFTTPPCTAGYAPDGFGGASRRLHTHIREQVVPHRGMLHPVLYNSWEATLFHVTEAGQRALARKAAALGVELFVVDDGWFRGRDHDRAGLGDWTADRRGFPRGLNPLIRYVNRLGMAFGLWVEPEMVNRDSDLYRKHPDWVLHYPGRERVEARNQLILNLARPDVQDHLIGVLDALLSRHAIAFIKWDMNRSVSEPGWPGAEQPRTVWTAYVHGLYHVLDTLRERHPGVVFQTCSGGGGRADLGMFARADQAWPSDNTDAVARLAIQEGYTQAYPAATMEAWVTDSGRGTVPLRFRMHVAMTGVLGMGGDLNRWTAEELAEARARIAEYKTLRPLVQFGEQYRLLPVQREDGGQNPYTAVQYMDAARRNGVLFVFRTLMSDPVDLAPIRLHGLDPAALYAIEGVETVMSGRAWMTLGVSVPLLTHMLWGENGEGLHVMPGNLSSTVRRITRV
jgi:alpha-galactosidase